MTNDEARMTKDGLRVKLFGFNGRMVVGEFSHDHND
jgi:hypothetical protein